MPDVASDIRLFPLLIYCDYTLVNDVTDLRQVGWRLVAVEVTDYSRQQVNDVTSKLVSWSLTPCR